MAPDEKKGLLASLNLSPQIASYFIAGGVAGAASRTVVSPLERLKIIQYVGHIIPFSHDVEEEADCVDRQVQPQNADGQYKGVWRSLVRMWKEEGFQGYMRGNGINCLRIVPYRCAALFRAACVSYRRGGQCRAVYNLRATQEG